MPSLPDRDYLRAAAYNPLLPSTRHLTALLNGICLRFGKGVLTLNRTIGTPCSPFCVGVFRFAKNLTYPSVDAYRRPSGGVDWLSGIVPFLQPLPCHLSPDVGARLAYAFFLIPAQSINNCHYLWTTMATELMSIVR
jgi:hypothetical protein